MTFESPDLVRVTAGWAGAFTIPAGVALTGVELPPCGVCGGRCEMLEAGVLGAEALLRCDILELMTGVDEVEDVDWPGVCCGRLGV